MAGHFITLTKTDEDFPITRNFATNEFRCPCCGELKISHDLVKSLQVLRDLVDLPLHINSGYRCPKHNAEVGGEPKSKHMKGEAADIRVPKGMEPVELAERAKAVEMITKIGVYNGYQNKYGFIHVDISRGVRTWGNW